MEWPSHFSLVLLPGLDGTGHLFRPFIECFPAPQQLEVIRYPSDECVSFDRLAEIAGAQLPPAGKFILLAESFSGPVAIRLAEHSRLAGVIFCASFLRSPRPILLRLAQLLPLSSVFRFQCPTTVLRFACFGSACSAATIQLFRETLAQVEPTVLADRLRVVAQLDDLQRASTLARPTCYLRPVDDKLVPRGCLAEISGVLNSMEIIEIEGAHFILQCSPKEAVEAVCRFSQSLLHTA